MPDLEGVRKRVEAAEELRSVVKTMKGMAAADVRHYEAAVDALDDYTRAIERGLQVLVREQPGRIAPRPEEDGERGPGPLGAIVFGSDQGMAGRFNQEIVGHTVAVLRSGDLPHEGLRIVVVGGRVVPLLEAEDLAVDRTVPHAASLPAITELVHTLLEQILAWRRDDAGGRARRAGAEGGPRGGEVDRVVVFYNESRGGSRYEAAHRQVFPVDVGWLRALGEETWPSRRLPTRSMAWGRLFASLIREFFYVTLFRAAAESRASENASRLAAMQAAERNIEDRLGDLTRAYRQLRQQSITQELLDITSGFEALES